MGEVIALFCALGCGLAAGVFFAFSAFVLNALARLSPPQSIQAMQAINITAVTPLFMTALFGTAALCLFLIVSALLRWQQPGALYLVLGGALYLVETILVTIVFNVPLNDRLAAVSPESADAAKIWASYLSAWTVWNHVRTLAALAAALLLTLAFRQQASP